MAKASNFQIELPDFFVHNGVTYAPGTHSLESQVVFDDLTAAKKRLLDAREKEAELEASRLASLNVSSSNISIGDSNGVSMDQLQELVNQAVEAKTVELNQKIDQQQERIAELEALVEEEGPVSDTTTDENDQASS